MRELGLLLFDVAAAVALFAAGAALHSALEWQSWFLPVSMLPTFLWLWWRGAFPQANALGILLVVAPLSLYFAVKDALWHDQPAWSIAIDVPIFIALMSATQYMVGRWFGLTERYN